MNECNFNNEFSFTVDYTFFISKHISTGYRSTNITTQLEI